jgi:tartrate-resistant acid phosphatase type 5
MGRRLAFVLIAFIAWIPRPAAGQEVNLIGFGDWGTESPDRQRVADAMADYVSQSPRPINCALSLGDNFYVSINSADDPEFKRLFEDTYDAKRMNFPFYALRGNHDYEINNGHAKYEWEMAYATVHPQSRWKMPAQWYRLDLPAGHPLVTILMLDSDKEGIGKQGSMSPQQWQDELAWINQQLSGPRAAWTICCAHHTTYSNGNKGDNGVLVLQWGSLFQKYGVDFYLCGHDHTLQHLEIPRVFTSYVVSGGGGAKRDLMLRDNRGPFSRSAAGFAAFTIDPGQATVRLIDSNGTVLHSFVRTKAGQVTILQNTPSDKRVKDPLRLIQGIDSASTQPVN